MADLYFYDPRDPKTGFLSNVLAPTHFIRRLMIYEQWFERASTPDAPPSAVLGNND